MIADVIIVEGNPAEDIRVLQDIQNILTVIKEGKVIDFSDESRLLLRPYEPAQIYQTDTLMFETVYGDPERRRSMPGPLPGGVGEAKTVAGRMKKGRVESR